jgi:hypothetical protein
LAALTKSPGDAKAYFQVLYAVLAMRDDEAFLAKARPLLEGADAATFGRWPLVAATLLEPAGKADGKALGQLVAELANPSRENLPTEAVLRAGGGGPEDLIALAAMACRRAGGETWTNFRAESKNLLGARPLAGSVIVLVNHLGRPDRTLASARP